MQKQVILIPYWVPEILRRNQMELSDCLNFEKIKPLMSLNDLVGFAALQDYAGMCIGIDKKEYSGFGSVISLWIESIPSSYLDLVDCLTKTVCTLVSDASFHADVKARLFNKDARVEQYPEPFITYDLSPKVCGVVIYPGFFGDKEGVAHQLGMVEAILKVLYVYNTHNEVSKTPLFKRYLQLLSERKIMV